MCTVIIEVPNNPDHAIRLLAVRDEQPEREWDAPGEWWPEQYPGVRGVRDRQAGGAWLAAGQNNLSVILNRAESVAQTLAPGSSPLGSRGNIVLSSVTGEQLPLPPYTESFNLVEVYSVIGSEPGCHSTAARVTHWNGVIVETIDLAPGLHMIAHSGIDDTDSARVALWAPEFKKLAGLPETQWREAWISLLANTAELDPDDDRAIIRDNTVHGYPTKSLLVCLASVNAESSNSGFSNADSNNADSNNADSKNSGGVLLESATLAEPAIWNGESFKRG